MLLVNGFEVAKAQGEAACYFVLCDGGSPNSQLRHDDAERILADLTVKM